MKYLNPKCSIKPKNVIRILKDYDQEVTHEQAELILDLLYKFGELLVKQYVIKDEKRWRESN